MDGIAAAGGFGIAMACDLVVASDRAAFEWAYHKTGLSGAESSTFFLPQLVGLRKALEFVLLNPRLTAAEARDLGLVNRVFPTDTFEAETMALARADGPRAIAVSTPSVAAARSRARASSASRPGINVGSSAGTHHATS